MPPPSSPPHFLGQRSKRTRSPGDKGCRHGGKVWLVEIIQAYIRRSQWWNHASIRIWFVCVIYVLMCKYEQSSACKYPPPSTWVWVFYTNTKIHSILFSLLFWAALHWIPWIWELQILTVKSFVNANACFTCIISSIFLCNLISDFCKGISFLLSTLLTGKDFIVTASIFTFTHSNGKVYGFIFLYMRCMSILCNFSQNF